VSAADREVATLAPAPAADASARGMTSARIVGWLRAHWALLGVLLAFAFAACIVPTLAPVSTTDDWAYARSAQILLQEGRLTIFPVVAATAVFQVAWGAFFGLLFGPSLGVFRLSTVVLTGLGALALYALCRDLGVDRERSALGVAAYLFNPLVFVLAFTFMTDPHFVAVLLVATWLFAGMLHEEAIDGRRALAGSAVTGVAFLTRQQGALIVPMVILFLLVTRRLRFDRASVVLLARLVAPLLLAMAAYYLWLRYGNDVPRVQQSFFREAVAEGWPGTWWLLRRLTVVELVYAGFFTLPIVAAALPFLPKLAGALSRRGWLLFALWEGVVIAGVAVFWVRGAQMPYIAQFFGSGGLGAPDVLGSRPILLGAGPRTALTVICVTASLALALVAARALDAPASIERARAGLVLAIGLGQVAGVLPPSYHYIGWSAGSLDRYLLPLVPLAIALALWALRGARLALPLGWLVAIGLALFAVAGTRDYLVFMRDVWAMGDRALAAGVPVDRLDAGAGWDGFHLYEDGEARHVRSRTPKGGPWWVYFYAPATDSAYVVAGAPLKGYAVVTKQPYSSWLQREPTTLYLLRRPYVPWPPVSLKGIQTRAPVDGLPPPPAASGPRPTTTLADVTATGEEANDG
jgi:4-amino-4-deoxy-L-arabinose transferase-like glycosyltransferase